MSCGGIRNRLCCYKFVFQNWNESLYEDLASRASTNDRRFFGRTGELLYLMVCRTQRKRELLTALTQRFTRVDARWDSIVKCLQPDDDQSEEPIGSPRANAFLPYAQHPCYDELVEDWLAVLRLNISGFDVFPNLVTLARRHVLKNQLTVS